MSMPVVYYKFKSCKDFSSMPILGQYISVGSFKAAIFESKRYGRGKDIDLLISNAQTNEEYKDEDARIPRFTSVLIRRVPGQPRLHIRPQPEELKVAEDNKPKITQDAINISATISRADPEESDLSDFGDDPLSILPKQEGQAAQPYKPANISSSGKVDEEDRKLRALLETSSSVGFISQNGGSSDRGYEQGIGGRKMGGCGFGRGLFEHREPPPGYVCHRCNQPGHFIQHCSTNGDPAYDRKRLKRPTGIPKSMLMTAPDGSYALPGGAVAVLQANEAAFAKAIDGIPTLARAAVVSTELLPEELRCSICKEIMKDAVLSKCCFESFCDKCIRDRIIYECKCVCGSRDVRTDDLVPNKTLRRTIQQMLESAATSSQMQDVSSSSSAVSGLSLETKGPAHVHECPHEGARARWEDSTAITKQKSHDSGLQSPQLSKKRSFNLISM